MAEHHNGPVELGASMDYPEHEKTYDFFIAASKYGTLFCVALLVAMAAGFFTSAGFFSSLLLLILINVLGVVVLR